MHLHEKKLVKCSGILVVPPEPLKIQVSSRSNAEVRRVFRCRKQHWAHGAHLAFNGTYEPLDPSGHLWLCHSSCPDSRRRRLRLLAVHSWDLQRLNWCVSWPAALRMGWLCLRLHGLSSEGQCDYDQDGAAQSGRAALLVSSYRRAMWLNPAL